MNVWKLISRHPSDLICRLLSRSLFVNLGQFSLTSDNCVNKAFAPAGEFPVQLPRMSAIIVKNLVRRHSTYSNEDELSALSVSG